MPVKIDRKSVEQSNSAPSLPVSAQTASVKLVVEGEFETTSLAHATDLRSIFNGTEAFSLVSAHIAEEPTPNREWHQNI